MCFCRILSSSAMRSSFSAMRSSFAPCQHEKNVADRPVQKRARCAMHTARARRIPCLHEHVDARPVRNIITRLSSLNVLRCAENLDTFLPRHRHLRRTSSTWTPRNAARERFNEGADCLKPPLEAGADASSRTTTAQPSAPLPPLRRPPWRSERGRAGSTCSRRRGIPRAGEIAPRVLREHTGPPKAPRDAAHAAVHAHQGIRNQTLQLTGFRRVCAT